MTGLEMRRKTAQYMLAAYLANKEHFSIHYLLHKYQGIFYYF